MSWIISGKVRYHPDLEPLMVDIDSITPHPDNYNNGDIDEIVESILDRGMYRPVQVHKATGYVLIGNHTWMACKELGATIIPRVTMDQSEVDALASMIADNEIARHARPDPGLLEAVAKRVSERERGLTGTGMSLNDLARLQELNDRALDTEDDFVQWPLFAVQLPPFVMRAFRHMTKDHGSDRERFEALMHMAGWDGSVDGPEVDGVQD